MDEAVRRAIAKWPNVPAVYGWLALDRRGRWLLRREPVENSIMTAFIGRNYAPDARGCWYFQNGPQRVFVDLDYTPLVVRVKEDGILITHAGRDVVSIDSAWIDEQGRVLVMTEQGPALVDDRDLESLWASITAAGRTCSEDELVAALEALQNGHAADLQIRYAGKTVPLRPISASDVPDRFGFNPLPRANTGPK